MEIARNKIVNSAKIGGIEIEFEELKCGNLTQYNLSDYYLKTIAFINDWNSGKKEFTLHTSGSTGTPKEIIVSRKQLEYSAEGTIKALALDSAHSALVCLNTQYIAGIMMLVRSMISGMKMIIFEPSSNPLASCSHTDRFDFTALVPLQMETILNHLPEKEGIVSNFKSIIIGGAGISAALKDKIEQVKAPVYATYGMTETLSHIALQRLNGENKQDYFEVLEGVELSLDSRGCLVIQSPVTLNQPVVTNDLVELLDEKSFRFLGRYDNVINSGGVKVFPEKIEEKIEKSFNQLNISRRFFVYGVKDERLGQKVVLFIEGEDFNTNELSSFFKDTLEKYELPKEIRFVKRFVMTGTGKVNRGETVKRI